MTDRLLALAELNRARQKYRPDVVRWLLVAESPPTIGSGRFFYFEEVPEGDSLFWQTIKTIYPNDCDPTSPPPRGNKRAFLRRLRDDGFREDVHVVDIHMRRQSCQGVSLSGERGAQVLDDLGRLRSPGARCAPTGCPP